jgi:uncharacterized protein YecT (DUF1311 family)
MGCGVVFLLLIACRETPRQDPPPSPTALPAAVQTAFANLPAPPHPLSLCLAKTTQGEMNSCASAEESRTNTELLKTLQRIRERYSDDMDFLQNLERSQSAWTNYLAAHLTARFPQTPPQDHYGSVYPMCSALDRIRLIEQRTQELRAWLQDHEEGDVCLGSYTQAEGP